MKVERRVFLGVGAFIVPLAAVYWFTSYERAGSLLLVASAVALLFLGAYLVGGSRHRPPRPEDRADGQVGDPGDVATVRVPTASLWPAVLGLGATLAAFALAYETWLAVPGLVIALVAVAGLVTESARAGRRSPGTSGPSTGS